MSLRRIPAAFRSFSSTRAALVKKPEEDPKTGAVPTVGSTYGGSSSSKGPLGGREGAMEDQWAYEHDKELVGSSGWRAQGRVAGHRGSSD